VSDARAFRIALIMIGAITLARVAVLFLSPLDLYPDEAQYWDWAVHPAFGYFSKPPFIAWMIGATMSVCGDGEACIRLGSPLLHGAAALMFFYLGRVLYDARTGLWSALAYVTLPGVSYSAGLISTDVPLLFFWAVALFAFIRAMREKGDAGYGWAALCGAAIGFGLLSKYAMLYFVLGAALAAVISVEARRLILSSRGLLAALIAVAVFAPNIVWNAAHGFATVGHTAANANWQHGGIHPLGSLEFLVSQFGVFGPLMMAAYLYALWRLARGQDTNPVSRMLACFSLPPLAVILVQAAISDANANWAAATYVAAVPLAVRVLMEMARGWALKASLALNGLIMLAMMLFVVSPEVAAAAGFANAYKRLQGWRELGETVTRDSAGGYQAIVTDNRSLMGALLYYARPRSIPLLIWDRDLRVENHFEMTALLTPAIGGRVLLVTDRNDPAPVIATFAHARFIGDITADLGGGKRRVTHLYEADGYRGSSP
jgi:4-amino-4-deoxy-L-arabinose transferase-like glycosyltransferase